MNYTPANFNDEANALRTAIGEVAIRAFEINHNARMAANMFEHRHGATVPEEVFSSLLATQAVIREISWLDTVATELTTAQRAAAKALDSCNRLLHRHPTPGNCALSKVVDDLLADMTVARLAAQGAAPGRVDDTGAMWLKALDEATELALAS